MKTIEQERKYKREYSRIWNKKHPGVQALRSKLFREKYPERWKETIKRYRLKNKDKIAIRQNIKSKEYYQEHKKEIRIKKKKEYAEIRLKENPNWIIKSDLPPYSWKFIREKVLKRDNYTCQHCGKVWIKGERKLDIHHIDGSGSNIPMKEKNNDMSNLTSLCHHCHIKVEIEKVGSFNKGGEHKNKRERNTMIFARSKNESQTQIARDVGLTRQRVSMIIQSVKKEYLNYII